MKRSECLTPWIGTGTEEDSNRPQLVNDYDIKKWSDVTGQPVSHPDPNSYTILAECEDAVLTQIEADATYHVLWSTDL